MDALPALPDQAFLARLAAYGHCDILVDRLPNFPLREQLEAQPANHLAVQPLADPFFAAMPEEAPLLVRIHEEEIAFIQGCLDHALEEASHPAGQTRAVCAFLFSRLPLATLARRLTRHLDLRIATGQRFLFRYFDPRVMDHLPRLLRPPQMAHLLDGIDHWDYVHWHGHGVSLAAADFGPRGQAPAYVRLHVDRGQWTAVLDIEAFNLALRTLRQEGLPLAGDIEDRLLGALETARRWGVAAPADQATLAVHVLREGEHVLSQQRWRTALQLARDEAIPLKDILEASIP